MSVSPYIRHVMAMIIVIAASFPSHARPDLRDRLDSFKERLEGFSYDSICRKLSTMPLDDFEGVWQLTADGGMIAIVSDDENDGTYLIVAVDSPDRTVYPGTVLGVASRSAKPGSCDSWLLTSMRGGILRSPKRFTMRLNAGTSISFISVSQGFQLNLWRILPYMFRHSVKRVDDRSRDLDGARRVFPRAMTTPLTPRYL